jgi:phage baseplate assembly protein W
MANTFKYININFPFRDSGKGFFLDLNVDDSNAIKADLMHLILTRKGERLYNPDFGTNLIRFIFEPNDSVTQSEIKTDIQDTVKKYLPNLVVNDVIVTPSETNEHLSRVRIDYTVTDDVFSETDFVIIEI